MARAYYTCPTCGKEVEVLGRNGRDADSKAAWLAKQNRPCWDCQRKAENEAAAAQAEEMGLPALEGTPKQVAWAETIRADFLGSKQAEENPAYAEWLKKQTSAKLFIDNRDGGLLRYWQVSVMLDMTEAEQDEEKKCAMLMEILRRTGRVFFMNNKELDARFKEICGDRDLFGKKETVTEQPAEETKPEEKPAPAPAPVKEWRKFAVNVQNITDTSKACKIAFPHSSKLDGYIIWVPAKLVRGGSHSYEATVSMHKDMTFRAIKYGQGDNWRDVIDEREVSQDEILEAFGGEVSGKFGPKQDVEEVITHTPAPLAPVHTEAAPELVR